MDRTEAELDHRADAGARRHRPTGGQPRGVHAAAGGQAPRALYEIQGYRFDLVTAKREAADMLVISSVHLIIRALELAQDLPKGNLYRLGSAALLDDQAVERPGDREGGALQGPSVRRVREQLSDQRFG
jgi:hypothetical protein